MTNPDKPSADGMLTQIRSSTPYGISRPLIGSWTTVNGQYFLFCTKHFQTYFLELNIRFLEHQPCANSEWCPAIPTFTNFLYLDVVEFHFSARIFDLKWKNKIKNNNNNTFHKAMSQSPRQSPSSSFHKVQSCKAHPPAGLWIWVF